MLLRLFNIFTSIFNSEVNHAVLQGLKYIGKSIQNKFTIFLDPKSVVSALKKFDNNITTLQGILEETAVLRRDNKDIVQSWISAHSEIEGSEKADAAAKRVPTL